MKLSVKPVPAENLDAHLAGARIGDGRLLRQFQDLGATEPGYANVLPRHENSLAHSSHGSEINRLPALPLDVGCRSDFLIAEGNRCRLWVGQSRRFRDRHVKSGCRFRNRPAPPFLITKHSNGHKRFSLLYSRHTVLPVHNLLFCDVRVQVFFVSAQAHMGAKGMTEGRHSRGEFLPSS